MIGLNKVAKLALAIGVPLGVLLLASEHIKQKRSDDVYEDGEKDGTPANKAVSIEIAFNWSWLTGADIELIMAILVNLKGPDDWEAVKQQYKKLTGNMLTRDLEGKLDTWEHLVIQAIYQIYIPDVAETAGKLMVRKVKAWAMRLRFWFYRGKPWWGSEIDEAAAQSVLKVFEEVPHAKLLPYLAQMYNYQFTDEDFITQLNLRLSDDNFSRLVTIIQTKPDAQGKSILELFKG